MCFDLTEEDKVNVDIDRSIELDHKKAPTSITLLMLGTGESGKSTILKQFRILHANGFSDAEMENFKHQLHVNVLSSIRALCRAAITLEFSRSSTKADAEFFAAINPFQTELVPELAARIQSLWDDPVIRKMHDRRSNLQVQSNSEYLLNSATRIADPNFAPTLQDILVSKVNTSGVVELQFILTGVKYTVLDLGGQRSERRKWHVFFQDISALIYVIAMDDYDLKLREDENVNRMEDSLALFSQICNMPVFDNTPIIIFLNKKDLFKEKLGRSDLAAFFPDYPGGGYEFACHFLKRKFLEKITTKKRLYTHFTCATSTQNIQKVFNDVRTSILFFNLDATRF